MSSVRVIKLLGWVVAWTALLALIKFGPLILAGK